MVNFKLYILIFLLLVITLISCGKKYTTNVKQRISNSLLIDGKNIEIKGYLDFRNLQDVRLYSTLDKKNDMFLDLIINDETLFDHKLLRKKTICIDVDGVFERYGDDILVLMNLASKHGLIKAEKIKKCK